MFYRKLLEWPIGIRDIEDGWPELAKGLQALRDWPGDDVEEVFSRSFVFSVDVFGTKLDVDMDRLRKKAERRKQSQRQRLDKRRFEENEVLSEDSKATFEIPKKAKVRKIPQVHSTGTTSKSAQGTHSDSSSSSSGSDGTPEPIMVTNENRDHYIRLYIAHLTDHSIARMWDAFELGFFTCIKRKTIHLFSAHQLKALIEGLPDIDIDALERITKYEGGFDAQHSTIQHFWTVVSSWPQEKVRQLLEFVTASDRLPTGGVERLTFVIQRNGAGDGGRLPTSLTCFGRLLLPEYHSEKMLREGLETAVENSKGFGQP